MFGIKALKMEFKNVAIITCCFMWPRDRKRSLVLVFTCLESSIKISSSIKTRTILPYFDVIIQL